MQKKSLCYNLLILFKLPLNDPGLKLEEEGVQLQTFEIRLLKGN